MHSSPTVARAQSAMPTPNRLVLTLAFLLMFVLPGNLCAKWKGEARLTSQEFFDSNVYMQKVTALANHESFGSTITPALGLSWTNDQEKDNMKLDLGYAPDIVYYYSEPSENYFKHLWKYNFTGRKDAWSWESINSFTWIDGNTVGPTFTGPGGAPAIGGIPIRNRRAALIFKNDFKLRYDLDNWMFRAAARYYYHDFMTEHRSTPGYLNYVDRDDINGGFDVGYNVGSKTYLVAGYRYGRQEQAKLLGSPIAYSSDYHRALFGIEGSPVSWAKLNISLGPDFRDFDSGGTAPGFKNGQTMLYIDSSVTFLPTSHDTVTFKVIQYEQPAFGGRSVYQDITYSMDYAHTFNNSWQAKLHLEAYGGEWEAPVDRDDWIYIINPAVVYTYNAKLSFEANYCYDWAESGIPNTAGREYERHIVYLGAKYSFY